MVSTEAGHPHGNRRISLGVFSYINNASRWTKSLVSLLAVLFLAVFLAAKAGRCNHIREKIVPGSTAQSAESELKNCGFRVTFDEEKKSLDGDKMVPGSPVSVRTQVTVKLDPNNKVSKVVVTTTFMPSG